MEDDGDISGGTHVEAPKSLADTERGDFDPMSAEEVQIFFNVTPNVLTDIWIPEVLQELRRPSTVNDDEEDRKKCFWELSYKIEDMDLMRMPNGPIYNLMSSLPGVKAPVRDSHPTLIWRDEDDEALPACTTLQLGYAIELIVKTQMKRLKTEPKLRREATASKVQVKHILNNKKEKASLVKRRLQAKKLKGRGYLLLVPASKEEDWNEGEAKQDDMMAEVDGIFSIKFDLLVPTDVREDATLEDYEPQHLQLKKVEQQLSRRRHTSCVEQELGFRPSQFSKFTIITSDEQLAEAIVASQQVHTVEVHEYTLFYAGNIAAFD